MNRLRGKVAIVTGATSGIGLGIVKEFAAEGAIVVATDIERRDVAFGASVSYHHLDVSSPKDWESVARRTCEDLGRIDVLVNNAGIGNWDSVTDLTETSWDRIIEVDQKSVWLGMRVVIPPMIASGGGAIINISSICGVVSRSGLHAYHAAKAAVLGMTRNAAVTYGRRTGERDRSGLYRYSFDREPGYGYQSGVLERYAHAQSGESR
jgi:NAD(P)-dependent dehydrogenase (short-subunit alcohol dehydrogenase family)